MVAANDIVEYKVSEKTVPASLGSAIAKCFEEGSKCVVVKAMGANAVNQAVKGTIIARQHLTPGAKDILLTPGFETAKTDRKPEVTVIVFSLTLKPF